ncbi:MAG: hypothetical protein ACRDIB_14050, partial [Ardenticatenaceae bacterium]
EELTPGAALLHHVIELTRDPHGNLVAGMQDGLWRLREGRWERFDTLGEQPIEALARLPGGTLLAGHRNGLYRSTDSGRTWALQKIGDGTSVVALAADPHDERGAWAGTYGERVWRTDDAGAQWHRLEQGQSRIAFIVGLFPDPHEEGYLIARVPYDRFYERARTDTTWKTRWNGISLSTQTFALAFDPHRPGHVWAGAYDGLLTRATHTAPWQYIAPALSGQTVLALLPDSTERAGLWIGATRGLYHSTDGGVTVAATALADITIGALARAGGADGWLYAGSRFYGLYASPDGARWLEVEALADRTITALVPSPEGVWAATDDGLWLVNHHGLQQGFIGTKDTARANGPAQLHTDHATLRPPPSALEVFAHLLNP